jgi:hypothetical protein
VKTTSLASELPAAVLRAALDKYWDAVEASDLGEVAKSIYMDMAEYFVRWMRNDFVPGSRNGPYRRSDSARENPTRTEFRE